jgi:rhodanese-related sulfurtransferase
MSSALSIPPATPAQAVAHFAARLSFETDVSDVHTDLETRTPGLVVIDFRNAQAWKQGHLPGAVHLPTAEIASRASRLIAPGTVVVTYCWGPGCNGATRAALAFATLGYQVKEMIARYRDAGQCSGFQAGGEGPRGSVLWGAIVS